MIQFVNQALKEKEEKASKCMNQFRKIGSCYRRGKCPFSHKITDEDRQNKDIKKSMNNKNNKDERTSQYEGNNASLL